MISCTVLYIDITQEIQLKDIHHNAFLVTYFPKCVFETTQFMQESNTTRRYEGGFTAIKTQHWTPIGFSVFMEWDTG